MKAFFQKFVLGQEKFSGNESKICVSSEMIITKVIRNFLLDKSSDPEAQPYVSHEC